MNKRKETPEVIALLDNIINGQYKSQNLKIELTEIRNKIYQSLSIKDNISTIDPLTGINNHLHFHKLLNKELSRSIKKGYHLSLLFFDIDYFKNINDTFGHKKGDAVIKTVADLIKSSIRNYDIASRYGGDEFTIIMPETDKKNAYKIAERIRKNILKYDFKFPSKQKNISLSISGGIATYPDNGKTSSLIINHADKALYLAKEEGKNRICISTITSNDKLRLVYLPPSLSPFYANTLKGIREVAADIGNIELMPFNTGSDSDYNKQIKLLIKAIEMNVDVIAICAKANLNDLIIKANKKGIKIFGFYVKSLNMNKGSKILSSVICDQKESGKKAAEYLTRILRHKGKIAILQGLKDEKDSIEREAGFREYVKKYNDIKIVTKEIAYWERNDAKKISKNILKKYPDIDAFYCLNDEMAIGVSETVNKLNKNGKIFIIGYDGTQEALKAIKKGNITATLSALPFELGKLLMRTIIRSIENENTINRVIKSETKIIDSENVDNHII